MSLCVTSLATAVLDWYSIYTIDQVIKVMVDAELVAVGADNKISTARKKTKRQFEVVN